MKKLYFIIIWLCTFTSVFGQKLMSPSQYLGYELGTRFTFHSDIERYCDHVVATKPQFFRKFNYGKSEEGRNLFVMLHTSANQLPYVNDLRISHLKNIGILNGEKNSENTLISWYSFNIHGDEAASSEASLEYLYFLANGETHSSDISIIDPCLNPDGRERYVQWFTSVKIDNGLYHKNAVELNQPWPEGRYNHYLSDLNRDWVWQTQKESQQRLKLYNSWMPHVHVDFHEMEPSKSYFFPPPAEPIHEATETYQKNILNKIGQDLEHVFKANKWDYFTEKEFDLLYPSYGDTYATFNGSLGLTLEQGGGDRAGLMYIKDNGDTLSLKSRIIKHLEAAKSLQKTTSKKRKEILSGFQEYHLSTAQNGNGTYKEFVIRNSIAAKTTYFIEQLDKLEIKYSYAGETKLAKGFSFEDKSITEFQININDIIISTYQPKGHLVRVLFEPQTSMKNFKTYDISGWAFPYLHHLKSYGLSERISIQTNEKTIEPPTSRSSNDTLGLAVYWNSPAAVKFIAQILQKDASITFNYLQDVPVLILPKDKNEDLFTGFLELAKELSIATEILHKKNARNIHKDLSPPIKQPKIGVIEGQGVSEEELGDIVFYFDRYLSYPISQISQNRFKNINYQDFDILIFSKGDYSNLDFDDDKLKRWLAHGGKLILIQSGLIIGQRLKIGTLNDKNLDEIYYSEERYQPTSLIQGAIFNTPLAHQSPLRHGLENGLNFILEDIPKYDIDKSNANYPSTIGHYNKLSGFVGETAKNHLENSFILGSYHFGNGIIYQFAINPLFRGIFEDGKVLMGNALFLPHTTKYKTSF